MDAHLDGQEEGEEVTDAKSSASSLEGGASALCVPGSSQQRHLRKAGKSYHQHGMSCLRMWFKRMDV